MKKRTVQRIGIFGGTFNPPHCGHLLMAESARVTAGLTKIFFVPAFLPPHKIGREIIPSRHRLAMTRLAVRGNRAFGVSDLEIRQKGISYTAETLRMMHSRMPDAELFLILGLDSLVEIQTWKEPDTIRDLARLLVYPRKGYDPRGGLSDVDYIKGPEIGISSTEIRGRASRGESIRYMVPDAVERYIRVHGLYGE